MNSGVIITVCVCFTSIVLATIGALAFIAIGRDGTIVPAIVASLGGIITAFTVVAGFLGKDLMQNVVPVLGKNVQTSTTVSSTSTPTPSPASPGTPAEGSTNGAS